MVVECMHLNLRSASVFGVRFSPEPPPERSIPTNMIAAGRRKLAKLNAVSPALLTERIEVLLMPFRQANPHSRLVRITKPFSFAI